MKSTKLSHKLVLGKCTVSNLDRAQLDALRGGTDRTLLLWSRCYCPDSESACECNPTD